MPQNASTQGAASEHATPPITAPRRTTVRHSLPVNGALAARRLRPCSSANTAGTKNSVATVASARPPITARPSGAFCSPPSPSPKRHRHHADDHRQRRHQHRAEACEAGFDRRLVAATPRASRSLAKLTTRMLFAVATPMHMMAPVSDGTLSVVCDQEQEPDDPGQRRRQRRDDDERIEPRLEVHDDQQVDQHDRQRRGRPAGRQTTSASSRSGRGR